MGSLSSRPSNKDSNVTNYSGGDFRKHRYRSGEVRLGEEEASKGNTVKQAGPWYSQSVTPLSNSGGHLSVLPQD